MSARWPILSRAVVAACAGLPLSLASCAGLELDLNPFYIGIVAPDPGAPEPARDSRSLGPLFDDAITTERRETAVHPLWRRVVTREGTTVQVLDPLFSYRRREARSEYRFLAFWWYRIHDPAHGPREWDLFGFPLVFAGGGGTPQDRYFALFPLFGTIKNFAGFLEAFFVLFPLYYRVDKNITEPESLHNVTPLIGWADGGPRDGSWRVLPLYGQWLWEGKSRRYSVLWPVFHYQRYNLDHPDPATLVAMWPLFKIDRSERHRFLSLLWPFFRFNRENVPARPGLAAESYFHYDVLWPLYRWQHTREFDRIRLFPFFSLYTSPDLDSEAYAIPFLWKRQERSEDWTKDSFHFAPLFHREITTYTDGRPPASELRLWPVFSRQTESDGEKLLEVPAYLPLSARRFTESFRANWGPLFRLYRDHERADGTRRIEALFRLFHYTRELDGTSWSVPLLYAGRHERGRTTHDLLLGLLRFGSGDGGAELRLLFVPLLRPEEPAP